MPCKTNENGSGGTVVVVILLEDRLDVLADGCDEKKCANREVSARLQKTAKMCVCHRHAGPL